MKVSTLITTVLILSVCAFASSSMAADCEEVYFSADDPNHQSPRKNPAPEFLQTLNLAKAGDAESQSEVAVSYDVGYLVAPCAKKAKYWYQKAAAQGNGLARDALRRDIIKAERDNREFIHVTQMSSQTGTSNQTRSQSGTSNNSEWTSTFDGGYIKLSTLVKTGSQVSFMQLFSLDAAQKTPDGRQYLSFITHTEVDCNSKQSKFISTTAYSEKMGRGQVVVQAGKSDDTIQFPSVGPLWDMTCGSIQQISTGDISPPTRRIAYKCTSSQGSVFYRSNPCPKRSYDSVFVNSSTGGGGGSAQVSGPVEQEILDRDLACKLAKEKRDRQQKSMQDRGHEMPEQFRQEVEKNVAEICRG